MNNNPCKQCIVSMMCKESCEAFRDYLSFKNCIYVKTKATFNKPSYIYFRDLADIIRMGKAITMFDDTKWRWDDIFPTVNIRRRK